MQDVEALYRSAVAAQESSQRRRQHLEAQRQAALSAATQRRQQAEVLDRQIAAVQTERAALKASLHSCNAAVNEAFATISSQVQYVVLGVLVVNAFQCHFF